MLRLSSLLPIIEVTPVQDNEPGRKEYRPPGSDNAIASEHIVKRTATEPEPRPVLERSTDSNLKSAVLAGRELAQQVLAESKSDPLPKLLSEQAAKTAQSASYGIVGLLNPALDDLSKPASSHETRFSLTATLLASLTHESPSSKDPSFIRSAAPLVRDAPNYPAVLAVALRNAISQSGLFYESHLEQWLNGTRTLDVLKQEPQGNLPPVVAFIPADIGSGAAQTAQPSITHEPLAWLQQNLVQQLSLLNNPTLIWTGQVWTGQQVTLQTGREAPKSIESEAPWVTRLSLEMPNLGKIEVIITIDSLGVDIDVQTGNSKAQTQLQNHQNALGNRLADTGCRLRRMNVRKPDEQG